MDGEHEPPPGVDRRSVQSLWIPNTRVYELTEEGFNAEDVIGGNITPNALDAEKISGIRDRVVRGGYTGSLVANDGTAAMVVAYNNSRRRTRTPRWMLQSATGWQPAREAK